ncbi:MFS transporter [Azorhizobium oxalatiphilum]|uniref:MFS transporter n=1 Tax=Azorhizobium oxalatiphilum TaxID=980631 RepID=A0A917BVZ9_9HYPH|nr:MFS transporter [Azorhizobium oxalatiphilum]GGF59608.1 MFS transporter [Azorhizobium oxalatiphilum]
MTADGNRPVRIALGSAYAALFFAQGINMPFFSLWLAARGLTPTEIGTALAIPLVTRLLATPLLGVLSDWLGKPKAVLATLAAVAVVLMSVMAFMRSTLAIFILLGIIALFWNPTFQLLDAYATRQARAGRVDYGRSRLWGSVAFIIANLAGGVVIAQAGQNATMALLLLGLAALLITCLLLPELPRALPVASAHLALPRARAALIAGIVAAALAQASHAPLYAFGSLNWQAQGYSLGVIGCLWATGVVSEVVLFHFGTRVLRRLPPALLLAAGGGAALVRFSLLSLDPPLVLLVPLQLLHGLTFGATYLGLVELVARAVPEHRAATMQSLAGWAVSLAMAAASVVAGPLFSAFGTGSFLLSAVLGLAGLCAAFLSARLQPQSSGAGG